MNRGRRYQQTKPFVSGGVYNGQQNNNAQQYQQQQHTPRQSYRQQQQYQNNQPVPQQQQPQPQQQQPQQQKQQRPCPVEEVQKVQEEKSVAEAPVAEKMQQDNEQEQYDGNSTNDASQSNDMDDSSELTDKNGKMRFKKIFLIRKKSSVRAREKKIRQNRQLRKAIMPKNALMALNEVKGIQMSDFVLNSNTSGGFTAVVTVNNNQYEGKGNSKASAKNDACEKALRDYVIAKMVRKPRTAKTTSESNVEPMDADDNENDEKDESKDTDNAEEQDDVPMVNLASFALFKLFSEWESEGFLVPEMHPTTPNGEANGTVTPKEQKKLPIRTELPSGWETMHPATLLCMMRPGVTYTDCGTFGDKPNVLQKVMVVVDEQEFYGSGRSKKIARRNAAVSVCNNLFSTNFEEEKTSSA